LSAYSFRLRQAMPDARWARRFIVTAFILEIRIEMFPITLFGDLLWMDLSWHASREKTAT
jgi:hypothetical protein